MLRRFVVTLPSEEYKQLRELADREERAVEQQASRLLRHTLQGSALGSLRREATGAGAAK
jgi:hypothetical protein